MSLNTETTSGVSTATSGADTDVSMTTSGVSEANVQHLEKVLKEKKNAVERLREVELENKKLKEEKLFTQQQFKELAEMRAREAEEWKGKYENQNEIIKSGTINSTLRNELMKLGLDTSNQANIDLALKSIDKSIVQVDSETGTVLGAAEAAKKFHLEYSHLGFFSKKSLGVNHSAPSADIPKTKTINEMTAREKAEYLASLIKR